MRIELGRPHEYARAKRLLNAGKHPTFIGRRQMERAALQGGLIFAVTAEGDAAVALISTRRGVLQALNVHPAWRSHGLGTWFLAFLKPNFARVVEHAEPWFERQGYVPCGDWHQGRRLRTRLMIRAGLMEVAGRVHRLMGMRCECAQVGHAEA